MGILSLMSVLVNWFETHRTTALAIMQTGISLGGLLVPLHALAIIAFGWRDVALASAVVVLLVGSVLVLQMVPEPERLGLRPDGGEISFSGPPLAESKAPTSLNVKQALRTRVFWSLSVGHLLAVSIVSSVTVHFILYVHTDLGFSIQIGAGVFALMTACSFGGQLLGGVLGDRVERKILAAVAMLGHCAGLLILAFVGNITGVILFAVIHGLAWGMRGPLMGALRADYFGRKHFPSIMGFSSIIVMVGNIGGPVITGVFSDLTGAYWPAFTLLAAGGLIGAFVFADSRAPA